MKKVIFRLKDTGGSTLVMVLIVFAVLMILITAMLSATVVSTNLSAAQISNEQDHFVAQSAVKSTINYILSSDTALLARIDSLTPASPTFTGQANFQGKGVTGTITVTATQFSNGKPTVLKITAQPSTASKWGKPAATAYLKRAATAVNEASPNNFLFYVSGTDMGLYSNNTGNIMSASDFTISGGSSTMGKILTKGNVTVRNASIKTGPITAVGNVQLDSGTINGDIVSGGTLNVNNAGTVINGSIYSNKAVTLAGATIQGSIRTNGTVSVANSGGSIGGSIYADGDVTINGSSIAGSVYTSGKCTVTGGTVGGTVIADGGVIISGGTIGGAVSCNGGVTISGGEITGNVSSKLDIAYTGFGKIDGNARTLGSLKMPQGSIGKDAAALGNIVMDNATIGGNASCGGTITFSSWSPRVNGGTLTLTGSDKYVIGPGNATLSSFSVKNVVVVSTIPAFTISAAAASTAVSFSTVSVSFTPVSISNPAAPSSAADPQLYQPVKMVNNTISQDGTIVGNTDSAKDLNLTSGALYTIDASANDISLFINNDFILDKYTSIKVIGTHNVIFYLSGSVTNFRLNQGNYLGPENTAGDIHVFVIGQNKNALGQPVVQNVNLCQNSGLYANVFIPNGKFTIENSFNSTYQRNGINCASVFRGSLITAAISTPWSVKMDYLKPDYTGTPLATAISGGVVTVQGAGSASSGGSGDTTPIGEGGPGGGNTSWAVDGWAQ